MSIAEVRFMSEDPNQSPIIFPGLVVFPPRAFPSMEGAPYFLRCTGGPWKRTAVDQLRYQQPARFGMIAAVNRGESEALCIVIAVII